MKTAIEKRMMNFQTDSFGIVHHARYLEIMGALGWCLILFLSILWGGSFFRR